MTFRSILISDNQNKSIGHFSFHGATIAFLLVLVFLTFIFSTGAGMTGKTFLQGLWEFFPLVTATVGGALGGILYYLTVHIWQQAGWKKIVMGIGGVIIYIVVTWMAFVAGFAATGQWD